MFPPSKGLSLKEDNITLRFSLCSRNLVHYINLLFKMVFKPLNCTSLFVLASLTSVICSTLDMSPHIVWKSQKKKNVQFKRQSIIAFLIRRTNMNNKPTSFGTGGFKTSNLYHKLEEKSENKLNDLESNRTRGGMDALVLLLKLDG